MDGTSGRGRLAAGLAAIVLMAALPASGARAEDGTALKSPHTHESRAIVGLKGLFVKEHTLERTELGGGLGSFVEFTLVEHGLELELGVVGVLPEESAAQLAFEPLLKVPFRLFDSVDPYLGAGPVLLWGAASPHLRGGGQLVAGSYFWVRDAFGFDLDVGFSLLSGKGALAYEWTFAFGQIGRF